MILTKRDKQVILEFLKKSNLFPIWLYYIAEEHKYLYSNPRKDAKNLIEYFSRSAFSYYVKSKTKRKLKYSVYKYFAKFLYDNYYSEYCKTCSTSPYFKHNLIEEQLF